MQKRMTLRTVASVAVAVAVGACASGTGGMSGTPSASGNTPTDANGNPTPAATSPTASGATGTSGSTTSGSGGSASAGSGSIAAPANTGTLVPTNIDTTGASKPGATGVAGSTVGTGTGVATLGTGLAPGSASGDMSAAFNGPALANIGSDARIVSAIDISNTDEISAGMLARQRAANARVRAFADRMVTEHTQMQTMDRNLAQQARFLSSDTANAGLAMRRMDNASLQQLQSLNGAAFDALYIQSQIDAHKRTLALLNAARDQARDASLKSMISGAIPKVQSHLDEATSLQTAIR